MMLMMIPDEALDSDPTLETKMDPTAPGRDPDSAQAQEMRMTTTQMAPGAAQLWDRTVETTLSTVDPTADEVQALGMTHTAPMAHEEALTAAEAPAWTEITTTKARSVPERALGSAPAPTTPQETGSGQGRDPDSAVTTTLTLTVLGEVQTSDLTGLAKDRLSEVPLMATAQERAQDSVPAKAMRRVNMDQMVPGEAQGSDPRETTVTTPERDRDLVRRTVRMTGNTAPMEPEEDPDSADQDMVGTTTSTDQMVPEEVPSLDRDEEETETNITLMVHEGEASSIPTALAEALSLAKTTGGKALDLAGLGTTQNMVPMEAGEEVVPILTAQGGAPRLAKEFMTISAKTTEVVETQTSALEDKARTPMAPTSAMMATFTDQTARESRTMDLMAKVPTLMAHTLVLMAISMAQMARGELAMALMG